MENRHGRGLDRHCPGGGGQHALFPADYYAKLGRVLRRDEEMDIDELTTHLSSMGYSPMDIVEMPGQFTRRGGIFDVYSPEADRPVRVELFGDEIESIRKFDPDTQRSSAAMDEAWLLPLTETPVSEELLAAVHLRLTGSRLDAGDDPELLSQAVTAGGVSVFPGWEFFCPVAGADRTLFDLFPKCRFWWKNPRWCATSWTAGGTKSSSVMNEAASVR